MSAIPLSHKTLHILYKAGITMLLLGILDPLEGSVVIVAGSSLLTFSAWKLRKPLRPWLVAAWAMIGAGVAYRFYISSLGGFLGSTGRTWVWGLPILPYPVGWLTTIVLLVMLWHRRTRREKFKSDTQP